MPLCSAAVCRLLLARRAPSGRFDRVGAAGCAPAEVRSATQPVRRPLATHLHDEHRAVNQPVGTLDEALHRAGPVQRRMLSRIGQPVEYRRRLSSHQHLPAGEPVGRRAARTGRAWRAGRAGRAGRRHGAGHGVLRLGRAGRQRRPLLTDARAHPHSTGRCRRRVDRLLVRLPGRSQPHPVSPSPDLRRRTLGREPPPKQPS